MKPGMDGRWGVGKRCNHRWMEPRQTPISRANSRRVMPDCRNCSQRARICSGVRRTRFIPSFYHSIRIP